MTDPRPDAPAADAADAAGPHRPDSASSGSGAPASLPLLRAKDLPPPLAALVSETVRRTRLRRRERLALEAELAAHLRDGLEAGGTPASLAEAFGSPQSVAPLLRKAVIVKRSALDRAFRSVLRWCCMIGAVLVAFYVIAALRLWWQRPTIAFDPIARANARLPDTDGNPAWPHYKDGLRWTKEVRSERLRLRAGGEPDAVEAVASTPGLVLLGLAGEGAEEDLWLRARALDVQTLQGHRSEIATLRRAASLPALGYPLRLGHEPQDFDFFTLGLPDEEIAARRAAAKEPVSPDFPALGILLPQLAELRAASRLLSADARLAAEEGDGARAAANLVAMLGVADHAEENGTLVGQLFGMAIRGQAAQSVRTLLALHPEAFEERDLSMLAKGLASIPDRAFEVDLAMEQITFEDFVQRLYSDDGRGDGVLLPRSFQRIERLTASVVPDPDFKTDSGVEQVLAFAAGPAGALLHPGRRATLSDYRKLTEATERESRRLPWDPEAGREISQIESDLFSPRQGALPGSGPSIVVRLLAPAISKAAIVRRHSRTPIEAAETAVALSRFHLRHQRWPEALQELVPEFLASVPRDPFDGAPLRYALRDGVPRLWSIGSDRVDNAGEPPGSANGGSGEGPPSGLLDDGPIAQWRRAQEPTGFVDPRTGHLVPRDAGGIGDWILWDPGLLSEWAPGLRPPPARPTGAVFHYGAG